MMVGFLDNDRKYDTVNMILSMTRWIIWKRRCILKFEKVSQPHISIENEIKYTLKNHTMTLLKSCFVSGIDTKKPLELLASLL